ncbi:MAG: 4Fe-4S dicluster domain-containing protein [Erysipelotrichia bacterium]|nr:4Fe-4S dicluster domain-containing protein [Erysipelotrichia bacterium]
MNSSEIVIDHSKCLKDGICINICPCQIFKQGTAGIPEVNTGLIDMCIKCGHCVSACPGNAISVSQLKNEDFRPAPTELPSLEAFSKLAMSRRSIRNFKDKPVEIELLQKLIDMTRFCPTAKNTQTLSWLIVNGPEKVRKVSAAVVETFRPNAKMAPMVEAFDQGQDPISRGAPQLAIIYGPEKYTWGTIDAAIATASFELAAKASGVGTCWGGFITTAATANKDIGKNLGLDDKEKIFAVIMLGYPRYTFKKVPPRNPLRLRIV